MAGAYDQFLQDALSASSPVNQVRPDAVLLAVDYRGLSLQATPGDADAAERTVEDAFGLLDTIRTSIRTHSGATCILQMLAPPPESLFRLAGPGAARHDAECG